MINLPKFIGHRGAAGFAPENTLVSMQVAKQCGAQMVEFDVKQTKDGVLVIMHDDTVQRTTNGTGNVIDLTFSQIRDLDAGRWFDPSFTGEKVPTLEEVFHILHELNMGANIEIKPCPHTDRLLAQNVVDFIQRHWPDSLPPPIVSSFSLECLRVVRRADDFLPIGLLFDDPVPANWKELAHELRASVVSLNQKSITSANLVAHMHKENLKVLAYTVNNLQRAQELYHFGVDSIFTNFPGAFNSTQLC